MTRDLRRVVGAFMEQGNSFLVGRSAVESKIWNLVVSKKQCSTLPPWGNDPKWLYQFLFKWVGLKPPTRNHGTTPPPQKKNKSCGISKVTEPVTADVFYVFILLCFKVRCNAIIGNSRESDTGWWFQTFFIFIPIWGRFPIWLIFFKWVETTT